MINGTQLHHEIPDAESKYRKAEVISYVFNYPCSSLETCFPYEVSLKRGRYIIELWGANGGNMMWHGCSCLNKLVYGGKGGYTSGVLTVSKPTTVYLYIGASGHNFPPDNGYVNSYNGGGYGTHATGGGGSTDVRLVPGEAGSDSSIKSRILIAGGGGGSDCGGRGGPGGGLIGGNATSGGTGGTQTSGGIGGINGKLWQGAYGEYQSSAGGGGGYYGGGFGTSSIDCGNGGGGGSSFASPLFSEVVMLNGNDTLIPWPSSLGRENIINGAARIIALDEIYMVITKKTLLFSPVFSLIIWLIS
jgi:hypothetical protein